MQKCVIWAPHHPQVDGGNEAVPSGQTAQQAGFESAMAFAQYLASKTLHLDVWDGESLLQVRVGGARGRWGGRGRCQRGASGLHHQLHL